MGRSRVEPLLCPVALPRVSLRAIRVSLLGLLQVQSFYQRGGIRMGAKGMGMSFSEGGCMAGHGDGMSVGVHAVVYVSSGEADKGMQE